MRKDMLLLAEKCFVGALDCATSKEGEQWLHLYMLGKTAEQLGKSPALFLDYYQRVSRMYYCTREFHLISIVTLFYI